MYCIKFWLSVNHLFPAGAHLQVKGVKGASIMLLHKHFDVSK